MLRAVTDPMKYTFIALILLAAGMAFLRGRMSDKAKRMIVLGAIGLSAFMFITESKFWGVLVMGAAIITLFFLPWLDRSPVKSMRYRPRWHFGLLMCFVVNFAILGYLGVAVTSETGGFISQACTLFYFGYLFLMPWWSSIGKFDVDDTDKQDFQPVPERVTFKPH
jgi:ubiquinol-cytochrome c reductase cytochrome b subunit